MRQVPRLFVSIPFALACGGAPIEDAVEDVNAGPSQGEEIGEIGTVRQPFVNQGFTWGGTPSVPNAPAERMWHDSRGFCFLTKISGDFQVELFGGPFNVTMGGYVELHVNQSDHYWYLGGHGSRNHQAKAICVEWDDFANGGAGHFYTANPAIQMAANPLGHSGVLSWQWLWFTDSICYLSGLDGRMDGGGEYARVRPIAHGGSPTGSAWILEAHTQSDDWTAGAAMCAFTGTTMRYGGRFYYRTTEGPRKRMTSVSNTVCMLSSVSGKFRGLGESVHIVSREGFWWLEGWSQQGELRAEAECIHIP
jgi:hypothetical protein